MKIPKTGTLEWLKEIVDVCTISQKDRTNRGLTYKNFAFYGAEQPQSAAVFNKCWTYLGDLRSLMYSPASLRFSIADPDVPSVLNEAKGRAASGRLRGHYRQSETDTTLSQGVLWSLIKGKAFVKQDYKRENLYPTLIQPEQMGVMNESHTKLDEDMEAFTFSQLLSPYQVARLVWDHPSRDSIISEAKTYIQEGMRNDFSSAEQGPMQVIVGGLYPFQPSGQGASANRGIVDWMGAPNAQLDTRVAAKLIRMDEAWVWDDEREDWTTFQMIGGKRIIFGDIFHTNKMGWDPVTKSVAESLKGLHPFREICPNPVDQYFWGRSEVINVMLLQYALNKRIDGINRLLRKQEDPPKKLTGVSGVNQTAISRFNKPGGYWSDSNPMAKMEEVVPSITADLWNDLHEIERMFDEMGGLPPVARGKGEAGVRGAGHAETLIRMATPRLKDAALLVERDVEGVAGLSVDLLKAHSDKKLIAWVPPQAAGIEAPEMTPDLQALVAPVPGFLPVRFRWGDLSEDITVTVESHSSSPAFTQDAKALLFDLLKVGAMTPADVVERVDISDPEGLLAGIERREAAQAAEIEKVSQEDPAAGVRLITGGKGRR